MLLSVLVKELMPWMLIKRKFEDYEGRELNPATVSEPLNNLVGMGIIEKVDDEYRIADPVYRLAAEHL